MVGLNPLISLRLQRGFYGREPFELLAPILLACLLRMGNGQRKRSRWLFEDSVSEMVSGAWFNTAERMPPESPTVDDVVET